MASSIAFSPLTDFGVARETQQQVNDIKDNVTKNHQEGLVLLHSRQFSEALPLLRAAFQQAYSSGSPLVPLLAFDLGVAATFHLAQAGSPLVSPVASPSASKESLGLANLSGEVRLEHEEEDEVGEEVVSSSSSADKGRFAKAFRKRSTSYNKVPLGARTSAEGKKKGFFRSSSFSQKTATSPSPTSAKPMAISTSDVNTAASALAYLLRQLSTKNSAAGLESRSASLFHYPFELGGEGHPWKGFPLFLGSFNLPEEEASAVRVQQVRIEVTQMLSILYGQLNKTFLREEYAKQAVQGAAQLRQRFNLPEKFEVLPAFKLL